MYNYYNLYLIIYFIIYKWISTYVLLMLPNQLSVNPNRQTQTVSDHPTPHSSIFQNFLNEYYVSKTFSRCLSLFRSVLWSYVRNVTSETVTIPLLRLLYSVVYLLIEPHIIDTLSPGFVSIVVTLFCSHI